MKNCILQYNWIVRSVKVLKI